MRWRRRIGLAVFLLAVVGAIDYGFMPKPVLVDTTTVTRAPLQVTVEEEGKTRVINRFVISAPVAGFARRIDLDVGDAVAKGQVLVELEALPSAVLDPRSQAQAQARVEATRAALNMAEENARAALALADFAQADLRRLKKLYQSGGASKENIDQAETEDRRARANLRSAEFAVEVAQFELDAARTALRYSAATAGDKSSERVAIRTPVNGRVLKLYRKSEGVVDSGEALLEIGDPHALEAEVDVLSADAVRISPGSRVLFERWGGDDPLEGRVRIVEPVGFTKISALGVEEQRVLVIADIVSPPQRWERLGDGYRVEASFILWQAEDVLQIPTSALFRHGEGWAVFAIEDEKARQRPVRVGHRSGLKAEIVSGLKAGETVIVHPDDTIADGVRIRARQG